MLLEESEGHLLPANFVLSQMRYSMSTIIQEATVDEAGHFHFPQPLLPGPTYVVQPVFSSNKHSITPLVHVIKVDQHHLKVPDFQLERKK